MRRGILSNPSYSFIHGNQRDSGEHPFLREKRNDGDSNHRPLAPQAVMKTTTPRRPTKKAVLSCLINPHVKDFPASIGTLLQNKDTRLFIYYTLLKSTQKL